MDIEEFLAQCVRIWRKENIGGLSWTWHRRMSREDKEAVERWIIDTQHPLGFEPMTAERRFYRLIRQMSTEASKQTILKG